jgi:hypothetical protein
MYLITKENSLLTPQNEGRFPIRVISQLNDLRPNDRWLCWESIVGVFFPGSEVAGALRLLLTSNSATKDAWSCNYTPSHVFMVW